MNFEIMGMKVPTEWSEYKRVLQKATTPSKDDFWRVALIAGAGIAFTGIVGFILFVLMSFIPM